MKKHQLVLSLLLLIQFHHATAKIVHMDDQELQQVYGQALLTLTQSSGNTPSDNSVIDFYKLAGDLKIYINANIKRLQLGCGGINGVSGCDIDIENLSISGLNDGQDAMGNPTFSSSRASTSAQITNPFIEFAIKNPANLSTRELLGFRLGAKEIFGLLTTGTDNSENPTDGIKSLSGYLNVGATTGSAMTIPTKFGDVYSERLRPPASLTAVGQTTTFTSDPTSPDSTAVTVPSSPATFQLPQTTITGSRMSSIVIKNISARVERIPLAAGSGIAGIDDSIFANDQLYVNLTDCILGVVCNSKFKMDTGSELSNLNINVSTYTQNLNTVHNIKLTGSGGYLSLQKENIKWIGTNVDDIAQRGWWLSIKDPLDVGALTLSDPIDASSVLPQAAELVSEYLGQNPVDPGITAINPIIDRPTRAVLKIDLGTATQLNPLTISLGSQILNNQKPPSNCYGNLKFC